MRSFAPKKFKVVPSLAPLFGVLLLVTVIFSSVSPLIGRQLGMELTSVRARVTAEELPPGQVVVRVTRSDLRVNGARVPPGELVDAVGTSLAGQPEPVVVLDASLDLPYERIIYFLDLLREAGADSVGLAPDLEQFLQDAKNLEPSAHAHPGDEPSKPEKRHSEDIQ